MFICRMVISDYTVGTLVTSVCWQRSSPFRETTFASMTSAQIIKDLPDLEEEDVRQALGYAAALAKDELHTFR